MNMNHPYFNEQCKSMEELFNIFTKHAIAYEEEQKMLREVQGDQYREPLFGHFNLYGALADMAFQIAILRKFLVDHLQEEEEDE